MTGLLYVAIVALWAAVLIPMWLRRHDDDQARRIDRHRTAMGALAGFRSDEEAPAAQSAERRRRTILASLVALCLLAGAAWFLGMASGWFLLAAIVMLGAFTGVMVIGQRMRAHDEALRALERATARREARRIVERPVRRAPAPPVISARLDDVFDQTA